MFFNKNLSQLYKIFKRKVSNKYKFITHNKGSKTIVNFRGCKVLVGLENKIESVLLSKNSRNYDLSNFTAIEKLVNKGDICLDVGANIGIYSLIFSKLSGNSQNIHSFEPVKHIRKKFYLNSRLNNFNNININPYALGAKNEVINMNQIKKDIFRGGTSSFIKNENWESIKEDDFEIIPVEINTLDSYVDEKNLSRLNFIKIDVEGFEWNVLQGGRKTLETLKPHILMEYDFKRHSAQQSPEQYEYFFKEIGYETYEFIDKGGELILLPYKFKNTPLNRNILCINSN